MTKQDFIIKYQEKMEISTKKESERLVVGLFELLEDILVSGENLTLVGFGKFETIQKVARVCRNPKTGELINIPEKKTVKFKAGKNLAERVENL